MMIATIVFVAVFAVAILLLTAIGLRGRQESKQTLERLDTVMAEAGPAPGQDEVVDLRRQELLSKNPLLNRLLHRVYIAPKLRLVLYQAGLDWTVGQVLLACAAVALLAFWVVYERTGATVLALLVGGGAACLPVLYILHKRRQTYDSIEQRLPEALDLMVGALRAGHSLTSSFSLVAKEMVGPISREFRQCVEEQNFGLELRTALTNLATRMPLQDVRTLVIAILIQKETGGNLAEILEKTAHVIRERFRLRRQISVHTAQGRLTGWILSLLPPILGFVFYLVNPKHMAILWERPVGIKLMWGSVAMTTIGALIIRKIVKIRV